MDGAGHPWTPPRHPGVLVAGIHIPGWIPAERMPE